MIEKDTKGILRYISNRIVSDVHDEHIDLNEIEARYQQGKYTIEEKYQYYALLGSSLDHLWNSACQDPRLEIEEIANES